MIKIDIVTIFPSMFEGALGLSILKRAQEKRLVAIETHDLRRWTDDKRGTVDNRPFGGGAGMIMKVEPIVKAIEELGTQNLEFRTWNMEHGQKVVLTSPRGRTWNQTMAKSYSQLDYLLVVCGHYEGVDERVNAYVDEVVSIGDFVLTGGEIPAMAMIDSIVRLIPGVLKQEKVTDNESFSLASENNTKLLEYPQYTLPREFRGVAVPEVLLNGNHDQIDKWRQHQSEAITKKYRPDLLDTINHTEDN